MPFQTVVNLQPAPAVEGDFASANPRATVEAGPGALVSGAGLTVGRFAWVASGVVTNAGSGVPAGFLHREQGLALITTFLAETSMVVPTGVEVTLHRSGDFWARFAAGAAVDQKVFASNTTGLCTAGAAGATIAGSTETPWFVDSVAAAGELAKISRRG